MSYSSKRTIVSMVVGVILTFAYVVYSLGDASPEPGDLKSWALALLVFIGISVATIIIVQIVFHIAFAVGISIREKEHDDKNVERIINSSMLEDERDKLIGLKSAHVGYGFAGAGFMACLIALAIGVSAVAVLHIMAGSFAAGSLIEGGIAVYLHERGVRNG